jgi:excisionase family DNA binding protein
MASVVQDSNFLTVAETAALPRQSERSIRRKVAAGEIPAVRLTDGSGPLRIDRRELEAWLYGPGASPPFGALEPAERRRPSVIQEESTLRQHGGLEEEESV